MLLSWILVTSISFVPCLEAVQDRPLIFFSFPDLQFSEHYLLPIFYQLSQKSANLHRQKDTHTVATFPAPTGLVMFHPFGITQLVSDFSLPLHIDAS